MGVMSVDHPDILEWIHIKDKRYVDKVVELKHSPGEKVEAIVAEDSHLENFNISVALTDEFMEKVRTNDPNPWMCKWKNKQYKPRIIKRDSRFRYTSIEEVNMTPRELFDEIAKSAHTSGDPGVVFIDTVNRANPLPGLGPLKTSNVRTIT